MCNDLERPWVEFGLLISPAPAQGCDRVVRVYGYEHGVEYQLCRLPASDDSGRISQLYGTVSSPQMEKSQLPPRITMKMC